MPARKDAVSRRKRLERDKQLIRLYAKGLTYQEIADNVGNITYRGVFNRIQYLRGKGVNLPSRNNSADWLVRELNHFCSMI